MLHKNAPLSPEGRRRLAERCRTRPIAHVASEMGISRACASKWVNRYRRHGELGLVDRSSVPRRQPTATGAEVVVAGLSAGPIGAVPQVRCSTSSPGTREKARSTT
jgi:transposase-like protein